jgi:hypothetical protein
MSLVGSIVVLIGAIGFLWYACSTLATGGRK